MTGWDTGERLAASMPFEYSVRHYSNYSPK
jgi:hypothetical protein